MQHVRLKNREDTNGDYYQITLHFIYDCKKENTTIAGGNFGNWFVFYIELCIGRKQNWYQEGEKPGFVL